MEADFITVSDPDSFQWDAIADLVIVGFGGAGVAAAIEAREAGLKVIAIDRFEGGGQRRSARAPFTLAAPRFCRNRDIAIPLRRPSNILPQKVSRYVQRRSRRFASKDLQLSSG